MPPARTLPAIRRTSFFRTNDQGLPGVAASALRAALEGCPRRRLSALELAVLTWDRLAVDVFDGGFEQFFYNNGGSTGVREAAELVKELGFPKVAATLREAEAIYKRNAKRFRTADPWKDLFGKIPELDAPGGRYARSMISPSRAIGKLLRQRIHELFVGDDGKPINPTFTGTVTVERKGVVIESMEVRKGKAHGAYRQFFDDGSLKQTAYYENGERSAKYWPTGQVRTRKRTERGNRVYEWFFPSGALQKRMVQDKKGNAIEPTRLYYENGQLAEELNYRDWEVFGPWRRYFEDGALKLDATIGEDNSLVVRNAWNDDRTQVVNNGKGVFYDDGKDIDTEFHLVSQNMWTFEMELKRGVKHGRVTTWADGELYTVGTYKNGRRHGPETGYWENGRKRWITFYENDEQNYSRRTQFPKFDDPRPAVILQVSADDRLYTAWDHPLLDEYPEPRNLEQVQRLFKLPQFLLDVDAKNRAQLERSPGDEGSDDDLDVELDPHEHWNEFEDSCGYLLKLDERGRVTAIQPTAAGNYSVAVADDYQRILRKLKFRPGRLKSRPIDCQVAISVSHTFLEGASPQGIPKSPPKKR